MRAADFMAIDRWAAARAVERGREDELETFVVAFDEPRLLGIRNHRWIVGNVVHVNGIDFAFFQTKAVAELFARWKTFQGLPATARPA